MMRRFLLTCAIDGSVDTFWRVFLDSSLNAFFYRDVLGFTQFDILEERATGNGLTRRIQCRPHWEPPVALRPFLDGQTYVEDARLSRADESWTWRIVPSKWSSLMSCEGTARVEAVSATRCLRHLETRVHSRLPLVGRFAEEFLGDFVTDAWRQGAGAINQWIAGVIPGVTRPSDAGRDAAGSK